jgi:dipeptidyl-peptidase-4
MLAISRAGAGSVKRFCPLIAVVSLALSLNIPGQTAPEKKPLTLEAIFAEGGITGRAPETVKWSPDGTRVSFVQRDDAGDHGELWYVDAATGEKKVLVGETKLATLAPPVGKIQDEREKERLTRYSVASYLWSPDSKHLLFDSRGQLWLYSLENGVALQFTSNPEPSVDPKFSPDGSHVAYVRKHNLYIQPISGKKEKRLTQDTDENILNGEVDWVYAEELEVRSNYFWSPDGSQVAFLQMDETRVPTYPITDWMPANPKVEMEKYPKPGDPNPSVRLGIVNASGGRTRWISLSDEPEVYVPRFGWLRNGWVWAQVLNRKQDHLDLYFVDTKSGRSRKALSETSDAWVNVNNDFRVLKSGDRFLWSSWRDGHTHLYLYRFDKENPLAAEARLERQLTKGDFEVFEVNAIDEDSGTVYFTGNPFDPRQQRLCTVKLDGSGFQPALKAEGNDQATFAENGKDFVERYSTRLTPPSWSVCNLERGCKKFRESRSAAGYDLIEPQFLEFKADDGTPLYGQLLLPPAGAAASGAKVPLIINVYGGPAEQLVREEWPGTTELFHQVMARKGFAIFTVDNRGTPNRGRKFSAAIGGQFGGVELKDQLAAMNQLLTQYPQLDKDRAAIWGWSNGGSMTLYSLTHSDAFKAGVSVAPVTDWHNYDSSYTERYLGLPKDNVEGYKNSALPAVAGKLHGSLLLVHGTSDDNVHFQNSIQMIDALIQAGQAFRFMPYPNKTHGIAGSAARTHLFHMIEEHLERELK